jgi:hypothetical protein
VRGWGRGQVQGGRSLYSKYNGESGWEILIFKKLGRKKGILKRISIRTQ